MDVDINPMTQVEVSEKYNMDDPVLCGGTSVLGRDSPSSLFPTSRCHKPDFSLNKTHLPEGESRT